MVSSEAKGTAKVAKTGDKPPPAFKPNKSPGKPANGQKFKPAGGAGAKRFDKPGGGFKKFDKSGGGTRGFKKFDKAGAGPGAKKFGGNSNNKFSGKPQATPAEGEKQDWAKFKQEKKDLKLKRKSTRDTYEITKEAKQIYEKLRW